MGDAWLSLGVAALTGAALLLTLLALRAWRLSGSRKVLFLAGAFAAFLAKGLLFSVGLFSVRAWSDLVLPGLALDVLALGLLYGAARRPA